MSDPTPDDVTPSGEPEPDPDEAAEQARHAEDPDTGSTPEDPAVDDTGLPPAGKDPMAGESPSS